MSEIVSGTLVLLGLSFLGYGLLRPFPSNDIRIGERLVLGLVLCLGVTSLFIFYWLLVGGQINSFSPWVLMGAALPGFILWIVDLWRGHGKPQDHPVPPHPLPLSTYEVAIIGVITLLLIEKAVFIAIQGFSFPTYFWDAVETWNYRAKVLHSMGRLDFDPQSATFLGGGPAPEYPIGPSLFRAWVATLIGGWSEKAVVLHSIGSYLLLFGLIWICLSKKIGWRSSLLFAYLAVSLPLIIHHAYSGYADLLLSLFFTGCLIYGYEYLLSQDQLCGIISALFLVNGLFTKNEALVLILPIVMITMLIAIWQKRLSIGPACVYLTIVALLMSPWVILKAHFGLGYSPRSMHTVFELHLNGLAQIFSVVFRQGSFNLFGIFFLLSAISCFPIWWRTDLRFLALPVLLSFGGVLSVFLLTNNYQFLESQTAINRSLMVFMPSYIYLVGLSTDMRQRKGDQ